MALDVGRLYLEVLGCGEWTCQEEGTTFSGVNTDPVDR